MSDRRKRIGDGPWPHTQWHLGQMYMAGGTSRDAEALRYAAPGTARRNVLRTLQIFRKHPEAADAIIDILTKSQGCIETRVISGLAACNVPHIQIPRKIWAGLIVLVGIYRQDLSQYLRRGKGSVAKWTEAFERSGWAPTADPKDQLLL